MAVIDYQAQFDISRQVPNRAEITAGWATQAAAYRAQARAELDLPYGDRPRQALDIFLPQTATDSLPVMFIHGGYWQYFDRTYFSHLARGLNANGRSVVVPGYTLAPEASLADIIEELRVACSWCWQRFGRPLVVAGHSAGGHLAATLLATDWSARGAPARVVVASYAISGLFDLRPLTHSTLNNALKLSEATAAELSPVLQAAPVGQIFDSVVGGEESSEFRRQSIEMGEVWRRAGVDARSKVVAGENHLTVIAALADPASAMVRRLVELTQIREPASRRAR